MNIIILGFWGGFFWSCFRVAAAIAIGVAVGVAVAAIASVAGLTPLAGVALGIGAGIAAGAIAYSLIGPYPEQTPSSPPTSEITRIVDPPPIEPPIETVIKEVVVSIRFKAPDDGSSPTIHFYCEIKDDNDWKPIQGVSQQDMLDQIRTHFIEIEKQRASDQNVVNNKKTETFFTIDVYKRPFPGDTILSELKKVSLERFNTPKDTYNIYDLEYSESKSEGDNK